jgi:hypothetical protein
MTPASAGDSFSSSSARQKIDDPLFKLLLASTDLRLAIGEPRNDRPQGGAERLRTMGGNRDERMQGADRISAGRFHETGLLGDFWQRGNAYAEVCSANFRPLARRLRPIFPAAWRRRSRNRAGLHGCNSRSGA